MFEAKAEWYMTNGEAPNVEMAYLVGAEEIAALNNRLTPLLRRLLDEAATFLAKSLACSMSASSS